MMKNDDLIQLIYESACNRHYEPLLHQLAITLDSNKAFISLIDKTSQHVPLYQMTIGQRAPNTTADLDQIAAKHNATIQSDPLYQPCCAQNEGVIFDDRAIDAQQLVSSDYFNEVYAPADTRYVVGVNLINNADFYGVVLFNRSGVQEPYSPKEHHEIEHWKPHLRKALMLHMQLGEKDRHLQCCQTVLNQSHYALALLTPHGCIVYFNTQFESLCRQSKLIQCMNNTLYSPLPKLNDQIQSALRDASKVLASASLSVCPKTIITPMCNQFPEMVIEISPFINRESDSQPHPAKGILVAVKTTKVTSAECAGQVYNLTQAETRLLKNLMEGRSLSDIADHQHVAISTVRSHLKSVLKKTQTHSQTELVILISQLLPY